MIERLIEICARNKFAVLLITAAAIATAAWCLKSIPLDAIPDLSDTQVIILSRWDQSPDIIEDQVTYPIVTAMLGAPNVKAVRGFSDFGFSYVYIIFEDGTDIYWARSRTLEYLSKILPRLPEGVRTEMGPDATSLGWVFQYALVDESGQNDLSELRSFQDWHLRYYLQAVPGVAEVATVGGFVRQYQVNLDPAKLYAYNIPIERVAQAIRRNNNDVGGRLVEFSGREYMVRGRGYAKSVGDLEKIGVGSDPKSGTPITIAELGKVELGPDIRRGVADLDGKGDVVGGIVVMRQGENALNVIDRVKARLAELEPTFPKGIKLITTYDRSELILRSISTLTNTLVEEIAIVSIIILIFLWHIPSAVVPILTIPISVILAFIPFYLMGLTVNIMSLAGIAISIGILVDGAIVEVENAYKKLERWIAGGRKGDFHKVRLDALKQVGPSVFFSLLVIAVSFLPIFTLIDQEGRLFKPLAYSKTFAMAIAAVLAVTLDPAIRMLFTRMEWKDFKPRWLSWIYNRATVGNYYPEERHPVSRRLFAVYEPVCRFILERPKKTIAIAGLLLLTAIPPFMMMGSEFMPPLNEGTILYMPTTLPGISVAEATNLLQEQDKILRGFPEVERVFGKAGRAETSTDPAPFSMMETTVVLKPKGEWREKGRWYSWLPERLKGPLRHIWSDRISWDELIAEMDKAMAFPGVTNAWTMPIKARIDMLSTGIRTPVGIKVMGDDPEVIEKTGKQIEAIIKEVPGTRSAFAERAAGGFFLDFTLKREELSRLGISIADAEETIMSAIGGENVSTTIEGRERYPINVRYARELRNDMTKLSRVLVATPGGAQVPISEIADIHLVEGPSMLRNENGLLSGYVYVDLADRDIGSYVAEAKKTVAEKLDLPAGYALQWSGQYENMQRVDERLKVVIPLTIFIIALILYLNTKSAIKSAIVFLAVPFSAIGAVWLLYLLGYHMSIAVWVGLIALMGLDAETGIFMLLYLDIAHDDARKSDSLKNISDLKEAIVHGAVRRIRPKMMTVTAAFMGLIPIMWSIGTGSDMMKRIAAPMVGGLVTSFAMELLVYPAVYLIWKRREFEKII
ncbi:MAG: CusA/CzcA family heavy metal efflux RND transporter [Pseudomonadota bacterium]